jgi:hypothetical protein
MKKSLNRIIQTNKISERKVIDLQQPVQSVPITTKAMSSNPRSWRGVFDINNLFISQQGKPASNNQQQLLN